jgi:hypothetical protein
MKKLDRTLFEGSVSWMRALVTTTRNRQHLFQIWSLLMLVWTSEDAFA